MSRILLVLVLGCALVPAAFAGVNLNGDLVQNANRDNSPFAASTRGTAPVCEDQVFAGSSVSRFRTSTGECLTFAELESRLRTANVRNNYAQQRATQQGQEGVSPSRPSAQERADAARRRAREMFNRGQ